jgi:CRISPR-associated protein Csd2
MSEAIKNRYEFVVLFDVENGNPNGDPDAGNMPRTDPETSIGIVTDVCIKRKIRNYVELAKENVPGYNILIKADKALNTKFTEAYTELGLKTGQKGKNASDVEQAKKYICDNYFDVRTFGAVMSTGNDPCGIVRGPVQLTFAKSISPVYPQDLTITRQAKTTIGRQQDAGSTEMGKKSVISYGLYRAEGYISAMLAQKVTGFSEDDLELLWNAIINMFEHDRSAARGKMTVHKLYIFKHQNALGNAPAGVLFDKINVQKKADVTIPRKFSDYEISIDSAMPEGVELIEKL